MTGTDAVARIAGQFSRFVLVGLVCTGLQYLLLVAGVEWLRLNAVFASAVGYLVSAGLSYALNRRITFGSLAPHRRALLRFVVVMAMGLLLNSACMQLLHGALQWHYVLAQLLATAMTTLWNFIAHRSWTFVAPRSS
jgi:putative flippase GtrA